MSQIRATVVMLGASNLTRGISTAVNWTQRLLGSPLSFYIALGHGRSYGMRSTVFGRALPGIRESRLWDDLERRDPAAPVYALITDIGNDILYKADVDAIVAWLRFATERLHAMGARMTIVQLPVHSIRSVTDFQFWLLDRVLYPGRKLKKDEIRANALRLVKEIEDLAARYGATLVEHDESWYGVDPIHFVPRQWRRAWGRIIGAWAGCDLFETPERCVAATRKALTQGLYLRALAPERRWFLGREFRRLQPAGRLPDGSVIHLY